MKILLQSLILIMVTLANGLNAQNIYFTQKARIIVSAHINGSEIQLTSSDLLARINYETANFILSIDPSTFSSGIDSLDRELDALKGNKIELIGKFNVESINTKGHPPMDFNFTGELSSNNQVITGKAHLEHIANNTSYACMLSIGFDLSIDNLGLRNSKHLFNNPISVKIIQAVLPRSTD